MPHTRSRALHALFAFLLGLLLCAGQAFAISPEQERRVNAMLDALAGQTDVVFIRNGSEHTAAEAVSHLRLKFGNVKKRLDTAEQFIDKAASSSSISGKPYLIRRPGQAAEPAGPFLHTLLRESGQ